MALILKPEIFHSNRLTVPVLCVFADWLGWGPAGSPNWMDLSQWVCWACELRCGSSAARPPLHPPWPGPLHLLAPGQTPHSDECLLPSLHLKHIYHNSRSKDNCKHASPGSMVLKEETSNSLIHNLLTRPFPETSRISLTIQAAHFGKVSISPLAKSMSIYRRCHLGSLQSVLIRAPLIIKASLSRSSWQGTALVARISDRFVLQNWCSQSQTSFRALSLSDRISLMTMSVFIRRAARISWVHSYSMGKGSLNITYMEYTYLLHQTILFTQLYLISAYIRICLEQKGNKV